MVAGPPRRAAVDASALARGQPVRGPGQGPPASRPLLALALALLLLPLPAGAWYKHVASPRYHTVGRAAGLLMGLRRSPYVWRRALRAAAGTPARDALAPGAVARDALLLRFPGLWEPWEAPRRSFTAGRPVRAPRSPPALEWRPGPRSPSAADPARYAGGGAVRERSDRRERGRPGRSGLGARVPRQGHRRATAEVARPPPHGAALFFLDPSERRIPPRHGIRSESPSPAPAWPADRCESIPGRDAPAPALGGAAAAEPGRVVNKTRLAAAPPRVTPFCVVYFAVQLRAADSRAHALANVRRPLRDRETGRGPSAAPANCPSWGGGQADSGSPPHSGMRSLVPGVDS